MITYIITLEKSVVIPVACVGRGGGSICTRVTALNGVEQLGNMLLSRLIHLDHGHLISEGKEFDNKLALFKHLAALNLKMRVKTIKVNKREPTDLRSACFLLTAPYLAYHNPISRPFRCGGGRSRYALRSWPKSELRPLEPSFLSNRSLLPSLCPRPPLLPLLPPPPLYP